MSIGALVAAPLVLADGTETLGPPSVTIASGTGVVVAGTGMEAYPDLPGSFTVNVPAGATVKQVLLYWEGHWTDHAPHPTNTPQIDGDETISVNGQPVLGTKIGGSTAFFSQGFGAVDGTEMFVTYRADITGLGLVGAGANTLTIDDMLFRSNFPNQTPFNQGNDGAGVLVVYDDGGTAASIGVRDGLDMAYANFAPPLNATVPQTFTFPASAFERTANLATLAGSVLGPDAPGPRANQLAITFAPVGAPIVIENPWQSNQGFEFDALNSSITIPAGASSMTVQAISGGPNGGSPSSLAWSAAALSVPPLRLGALGDFVWNDINMNGIQDTGEPSILGVTVKLYDCAGNELATTTTDASGLYLFSGLAAGGYRVEFVLPANFQFSPQDQGANDAVDSDANTSTGMTGCYTLAEGETNLTVDAGMFTTVTPSAGTATGFGPQWPNTNNWFMYTPYTTSKVDLVSGAKYTDVGDIFMSRANKMTVITIVIAPGWDWATMSELVKIHPMDKAPTAYLEPGKFLYKFTPPDLAKDPTTSVVFSGNTATMTLPGTSAKFYGIHTGVVKQ